MMDDPTKRFLSLGKRALSNVSAARTTVCRRRRCRSGRDSHTILVWIILPPWTQKGSRSRDDVHGFDFVSFRICALQTLLLLLCFLIGVLKCYYSRLCIIFVCSSILIYGWNEKTIDTHTYIYLYLYIPISIYDQMMRVLVNFGCPS